ncbi:MAG: divergent polysaccharide deacetylase family protein [Pseudomonadota bacterium]|nr:divergent polysaccharide deacetylase family protein [Pseudomonadota bacterium]
MTDMPIEPGPSRGRRPVAQTALVLATLLVLGTVGGTVGWLWWADSQEHEAAGATTADTESGHAGSGHAEDSHGAAAKADGDSGHGATPTAPPSRGDSHAATPKPSTGHGQADSHDSAPPVAHAPPPGTAAATGHDATANTESHDSQAHTDGSGLGDSHARQVDGHADTPAPATAPAPATGQDATPPRTVPQPPRIVGPGPVPNVVQAERTPLAPAPDPAITTSGKYGPLPMRAADGTVAWRTYGRPFDAPAGKPRIAIIVGGLGLAEQPTLAAIQDLPGEVSLAFSPYSSRLAEWIPAARAAGHEVLLQVPMEPRNTEFEDPGERALMVGDTPEINIDRLEWVLSRATGYVGVINFMGSRMTVSPRDLQPVLDSVDARGLLFVDARTTPESIAAKMASELGLPTAAVDRTIDAEAARNPIDERLAQLEQIALTRQVAVGIAGDYPVTIERLRFWIGGLSARGFALAPISAVARIADGQ